MRTRPSANGGRLALRLLPVIIVVGGFIAVLRWLRPHNSTFVLVLTAVVAAAVMGYTSFLGRRESRRWDEVQSAGYQFANTHGWGAGAGITLLLLLVPAVTNRLIDLASLLSTGSPALTNRASVQMALFFGLMLVVLMQGIAVVVASLIWHRRIGRP